MLTWMELSCSKSSVSLSVLAVPRRIGEGLSHLSGVARGRAVPLELTGQRRLLGPASQTVKATEGSKTGGQEETEGQFHNPCGSSAGTLSDIAGRRKILRRPIFKSYLALGSSLSNLNIKKKGHLTLVE